MALYPAMRPVTLRARLNQLERRVRVVESNEEREGHELLARWLAANDANVEWLLDYEESVAFAGSRAEALALASGRAVLEAIAESLFALPEDAELR